MRTERNPYALGCLAKTVGALGPKASNGASSDAMKLLGARMQAETKSEDLEALAAGLGSIA